MNEEIDKGSLLHRVSYSFKKNISDYDSIADPCIRTHTLLKVISNFEEHLNNPINQESEKSNQFFIIHPILKHLAILSQ